MVIMEIYCGFSETLAMAFVCANNKYRDELVDIQSHIFKFSEPTLFNTISTSIFIPIMMLISVHNSWYR